jgi:hypothetical protein
VSIQPQIPVAFEVAGTIAGVVVVGLVVAAMIAIASSARLAPTGRVVWLVAVVLAPPAGAVAWFATAGIAKLAKRSPRPSGP